MNKKKVNEQKYYTLLHQLLVETRKAGISAKGKTGIICITKNNETQTFVFSDIVIQNISKQSFLHNIKYLHFPATTYQCKPSFFVDISNKKILQQTLPEDFENGTVILTELFNKQFDYKQLLFKLRWEI